MKILTAAQIRETDTFTIANEPIQSIDLMERAALAFTHWYITHFDNFRPVKVICGQGNNGGDGLAVARMLSDGQHKVEAFVVRQKEKGSPDFETNRQRLSEIMKIRYIRDKDDIPVFDEAEVVIDALFGTGLSRPVEGLYAEVIEAINRGEATRVAIDIASGLISDHHSEGPVVKADYTISFQLPKLAFLLPENADYVGEWSVVDIRLHHQFIEDIYTSYEYVTGELIARLLKKRKKYAHKGSFGHSLMICGSKGKIGAAVLSSKACLKTGAGLVTVYVPGCGYEILQTSVPEAMVITDEMDAYLSSVPEIDRFTVTGVGPGIGMNEQTVAFLRLLLEKATRPMVIDADALNIIGQHPEMLQKIPRHSILTPHPKEFERIAGKASNDFERLTLQKELSEKYEVYVLVKGAHTSLATPDGKVYFNSSGNPGMAKGGSGDVLTGMLTALLGQQYSPQEAALIGIFLHGLAADQAAEYIAQESITASDIIHHISAAYKVLQRRNAHK